jgi:hypothetical protein
MSRKPRTSKATPDEAYEKANEALLKFVRALARMHARNDIARERESDEKGSHLR